MGDPVLSDYSNPRQMDLLRCRAVGDEGIGAAGRGGEVAQGPVVGSAVVRQRVAQAQPLVVQESDVIVQHGVESDVGLILP